MLKSEKRHTRAYGEWGCLERRVVVSLRAFLNCRESMASQMGRTRRSGIPPAKPNLEAIFCLIPGLESQDCNQILDTWLCFVASK